jgi:hypothetical protein
MFLGLSLGVTNRRGSAAATIVVAPDADGLVTVTAANAAAWVGAQLSITTAGGNVGLRLLDETPDWFSCTVVKSNAGGGMIEVIYYGMTGGLSVPIGALPLIAEADDVMTVYAGANRYWLIGGDLLWS